MTTETAAKPATWPQGFAINPRGAGPAPALIEALRGTPVAWISDCLGRSSGSIGLNYYHGDVNLKMCGLAFTVRIRPGDNLMIHKAIELAEPGDVIVVDGGGDISQALIGANMRTSAIRRKLAGIVLDGALRDLAELSDGRLPCYAKGYTHRGPSKEGPGEINVPIACAGMVVHPGDLIIGDADGVIALPPAILPGLLPLVRKQAEKEAYLQKANAEGTADPERFNSILRQKGCPI